MRDKRRSHEEDYYSKDYWQHWDRPIGGLFIAGLVLAAIIGVAKVVEWLYHKFVIARIDKKD
jgi:hypothetical protein